MIRLRTYTAIPAKAEKRRAADSGGFSLVELMVVIVIFAIIVGLIAGNWAGFASYNELRMEATGFHKELLALKAKAVADGDTVKISKGTNSYTPTMVPPASSGESNKALPSVDLKRGTISTSNVNGTGLTLPSSNNKWASTIKITPDNVNAFEEGWWVIENGKDQFCIVKNGTNVKPEIFHKKGTGSWRRL